MFPIRSFLAASGTAIVVALLMWVFGDAVPGEELWQFVMQLLLIGVGQGVLPPLAFGWAARDTNIYPLSMVVAAMIAAQMALMVLLYCGGMTFATAISKGVGTGVGSVGWFVIETVILPTLSALLALAVTGNLRRVIGSGG